jgi:hypothetical protein
MAEQMESCLVVDALERTAEMADTLDAIIHSW